MDLLEYQAKELFRQVGIPTLPAQTIAEPRQIKQLQIPYPVVLKSQVKAGGRGKAGGVRFVSNTIDAIAAARSIFNLSILREYPKAILAEAHYNAEREFFLAIVLDYNLQCPVLLGSAYGGMNLEPLLANLHQVPIDTEFSSFYARRLAVNMQLTGELVCSVSQIIENMYELFKAKDLESIEINPLGVNERGELMALDGKITINDSAIGRHPDIATLANLDDKAICNLRSQSHKRQNESNLRWLNWQEPNNKIGIITNSFDLTILAWDLICRRQAKPACGMVIEPRANTTEAYWQQLKLSLTELIYSDKIQVILVNIWELAISSRDLVEAIADCYLNEQKTSLIASPTKLVLRFTNCETVADIEGLGATETIYLIDSLEEAISLTVTLAKNES
ncbi:ATP-grasp domain-containing protein [Myxosarcina sp. GI1]|uniref:ATP-grasp domain-containing protein n=1 Tax=Myxosarcina sp. GI1 TaxID=1541065 RepID=UPI00055B01B7|nr:ATP-grasp domain-containing protein [Myxosarcina sp. GI1]